MNSQKTLWIGAYGDEKEETVIKVLVDCSRGRVSVKEGVSGLTNPSWVLPHPDGKVLYCVAEKSPEGNVLELDLTSSGWKTSKSMRSGGADPCHLSLDDRREFLFVSNYTSGSLAVFRIDPDGHLLERTDLRQHTGGSINPERQEGPHVHYSMFHGGKLFVSDLGQDRIIIYDLNRETGILSECGDIRITAGQGPRHFLFRKSAGGEEFLYVICEMGASIFVFHKTHEDAFEQIQKVELAPDLPDGKKWAAAIHFSEEADSGRRHLSASEGTSSRQLLSASEGTSSRQYLFASERTSGRISVLKIGEDGKLSLTGAYDSGVRVPRDFAVCGNLLVTLGQESGDIRVLKFDPISGRLSLTGSQIEFPVRPVCAAMARD